MAPSEMEPELKEGVWLVLVAAVWSGPDRMAIQQALTAVKEFGGKLKLGIRLFDEDSETTQWFPDLPQAYASPVWLFLRDGRLVEKHFGSLDQIGLRSLLQQAIDETSPAG